MTNSGISVKKSFGNRYALAYYAASLDCFAADNQREWKAATDWYRRKCKGFIPADQVHLFKLMEF